MDVPPDLVRAAQRGDRAAMEELISRSYRPAYTLALRLLGNPDDAAEATQDAYVRMMKGLRTFREVGAFPTWLFKIVSNVCMTEMRKRSRRAIPSEFPAEQEHERAPDAEEVAVGELVRHEIERCIERLPDVYRTVIVLRDIYGMSGGEVAEVLDVSPGAVKVRLHRARRRLRDEILTEFPDWGREGTGPKERESA